MGEENTNVPEIALTPEELAAKEAAEAEAKQQAEAEVAAKEAEEKARLEVEAAAKQAEETVQASLAEQPTLPENVKEFTENGKRWRKTVENGRTVSCVEIDENGVEVPKV